MTEHHPDVAAAIAKLEAAHAAQQKKLVNLTIHETSAVDFPAHGVSGWLVQKAGTPAEHQHDPAAMYLHESPKQAASLFDLKTGEEKQFAENRYLGKDACGCLYVRSQETVDKAAGQDYAQYRQQESLAKEAGPRYTAEDSAYLVAETNRLLGRS